MAQDGTQFCFMSNADEEDQVINDPYEMAHTYIIQKLMLFLRLWIHVKVTLADRFNA